MRAEDIPPALRGAFERWRNFCAQPLRDRFWGKVKIGSPDECWPYQGAPSPRGYMQFAVNGRQWRAHRIAWILERGHIPDGHFVCHKCDNPPCCNPNHLFTGTVQDNHADMMAKGRHPKGAAWKRSNLTDAIVLEIRKRYHPGKTTYEMLAREFGVSNVDVGLIVRGKIWKHLPVEERKPRVRPKGEQIGRAVLTEAIVKEIKRRLANGEKQSSIARIMLLNKHTVGHVARRRCWKHVQIIPTV